MPDHTDKVAMDAITEIGGTPLEHPPVPLSSWSLRQTVCSTFSRSGWSVVRSISLARGGTSKERPSLYLHKVSTWSNNVRPRTCQTALVHCSETAWAQSRRALIPTENVFHLHVVPPYLNRDSGDRVTAVLNTISGRCGWNATAKSYVKLAYILFLICCLDLTFEVFTIA
jgi:hypothetical protein